MNKAQPVTEDMEKLMASYDISRVPIDRFHYKSYRYSDLRDAIAQAQRDKLAIEK